MSRSTLLLLLAAGLASAVIIDRVAIVAGNAIIKDSDIVRDIRVTDFLNNAPVDLGPAARKAAASRLLDQVFIRREIRIGDYPTAAPSEAEQQLAELKKNKYRSSGAYESALQRYGLTDAELRAQFRWQLSVLRFIDARFRPAAYVPEQQIDTYYKEHEAALHRQYPHQSLEQLRNSIRDILSGERVNQLFFAWLDEQRKSTEVKYLEDGLR